MFFLPFGSTSRKPVICTTTVTSPAGIPASNSGNRINTCGSPDGDGGTGDVGDRGIPVMVGKRVVSGGVVRFPSGATHPLMAIPSVSIPITHMLINELFMGSK